MLHDLNKNMARVVEQMIFCTRREITHDHAICVTIPSRQLIDEHGRALSSQWIYSTLPQCPDDLEWRVRLDEAQVNAKYGDVYLVLVLTKRFWSASGVPHALRLESDLREVAEKLLKVPA